MIKSVMTLLILTVCVACTSNPKTPHALSEGGGSKSIVGMDDASSPSPAKVQKYAADKPPLPNPRPPKQSTPAHDLSFWIELIGSGMPQKVSASTVFKSGDSIRLHVRSNRSGYLYVVNRGSSGRTNYLFPSSPGSSEYIKEKQTVTIPSSGGIRFDETPGEELVWVFVSQHPLPNKDTGGRQMQVDNSSAQDQYNLCGSKDLVMESPDDLQKSCSKGSKDLMVEGNGASEESVANVSLPDEAMEKGQMLSLRLLLRHK